MVSITPGHVYRPDYETLTATYVGPVRDHSRGEEAHVG